MFLINVYDLLSFVLKDILHVNRFEFPISLNSRRQSKVYFHQRLEKNKLE